MMRAPRFWRTQGGALSRLLHPLAQLVTRVAAWRASRPGWRAPVPVICCGNATVGGAGKTTLALDLGRRLNARGVKPHFLIRGYGGKARQSRAVTPGDTAASVGDEALLLADVAPTWVGGDRAASARGAIGKGARALIMDDGLQNPTLERDLCLLVIDGATGFGNGEVLPAGPLREPVAAAAARCQAAVLIGEDATGALAQLPPALPVLRARLRPGPEMRSLAGRRLFAFAGIASPDKFFNSLTEVGAHIVARAAFADHHPFTEAEITRLMEQARQANATPVTTPKDAARLPPALRRLVLIAGVDLEWQDPTEIEALLARAIDAKKGQGTLLP